MKRAAAKPTKLFTLRATRLDDCSTLAHRMRPEDVTEVAAGAGMTPMQAVQASYLASVPCSWSFVKNASGEPLAMMGVRAIGRIGLPWFLSTVEFEKEVPVQLVVSSAHRVMLQMAKDAEVDHLTNCVWAGHKSAVRFLRWMGFSLTQLHPRWGVGTQPFWEFHADVQHLYDLAQARGFLSRV